MRQAVLISAVVLVAASLLLMGLWVGSSLNRSAPNQTGHEVFIEAVPVPDVSSITGAMFNFTVVVKNPNDVALFYRPNLTISTYNSTNNQTLYSSRIPLNASFRLLSRRVTTIYNGTISLGQDAIGRPYWLTAASPSTEQVKITSERILIPFLMPNAG